MAHMHFLKKNCWSSCTDTCQ